MSDRIIGPAGVEFFGGRKIKLETARRFGVYTAKRRGRDAVEDAAGKLLVFPYFEDEAVVAEKYRGPLPDKAFSQRPGGKKIFWNIDALDLAVAGADDEHPPRPVFIFEGEVDALTAIDCGIEESMSVPDGAPAQLGEVDPEKERTGKFAYVWNCRKKLHDIREFVLAVDNDEAGQVLQAELVRRLGASRCSFVEYPDGCKDISDVRVRHGPEAVTRVLMARKRYPVTGLYRLSDYPDAPKLRAYSTGWKALDGHLMLFPGEFMVVTGIPGHGKSSWVLDLCMRLADLHGWRSAIFSPEMPIVPLLRDKLRTMRAGRQIWSDEERRAADDWTERTLVFLDKDPSTEVEGEEMTLDWIIDKAFEAVISHGVRVLVIDPWNEVEHVLGKRENQTDYIGRSIRALRRFAQERGLVVIVVAHPTKDIAKDGKQRTPKPYDIDGSAHWNNKPDHVVIIHRKPQTKDKPERTQVGIEKVRFAPTTGTRGAVYLKFDARSERFMETDERGGVVYGEQEEMEEFR